jgi:hypothetical protein
MRYAFAPLLMLPLAGCLTTGGLPADQNAQIQQAAMVACGILPSGPQIAAALSASAKTQAQVVALTTVGSIVCAYLGYAPTTVVVPPKAAG